MTFLSYAQNYEDVLLWRALGHIKNGFYIDVGANDPVEHSVTKAFYDAGWHGVNIEPLPSYHQAFREGRPHDVNLAIAAGAADGSITLYDVPAVHGWASSDQAVAEAHRADGFEVTELTVPVRTLASVCEQYVTGEIHFLKVDVEGFEGEVLKGMDFVRWRPWVLVIEATLPNSRVSNHAAWESMVTTRGYRFAWFDGLNRYYVADEHAELAAVLSVQPNVFDEYITYHLDRAWQATEALKQTRQRETARANAAEIQADAANGRAARAEERAELADTAARQAIQSAAQLVDRMAHVQAQYDAQGAVLAQTQSWARDLDARLTATLASSSWRVTAPLRFVGAMPRRLREGGAGSSARGLVRQLLVRVTANERLRRMLIPLLLRFPEQAAHVSKLLAAIKKPQPVAGAAAPEVPDELRAMPLQARRVLADLQRARRTTTNR